MSDFGVRSKAEHGTNAGFQQHNLKGVPMCDRCHRARKVYLASYYQRNKYRWDERKRQAR